MTRFDSRWKREDSILHYTLESPQLFIVWHLLEFLPWLSSRRDARGLYDIILPRTAAAALRLFSSSWTSSCCCCCCCCCHLRLWCTRETYKYFHVLNRLLCRWTQSPTSQTRRRPSSSSAIYRCWGERMADGPRSGIEFYSNFVVVRERLNDDHWPSSFVVIYKLRLLMSQRCDRSISSPGPKMIARWSYTKISTLWESRWHCFLFACAPLFKLYYFIPTVFG